MAGEFNHFEQVLDAIVPACKDAVTKTAKAGKRNVQGHIQGNGQVRTGFMLNSVYVETPEGSDYTGGQHAFDSVGAPPDKTTAYFAVAADYSPYQNYGTRFIPPRPFWEPGVDDTAKDYEQALGEAMRQIEAAA